MGVWARLKAVPFSNQVSADGGGYCLPFPRGFERAQLRIGSSRSLSTLLTQLKSRTLSNHASDNGDGHCLPVRAETRLRSSPRFGWCRQLHLLTPAWQTP